MAELSAGTHPAAFDGTSQQPRPSPAAPAPGHVLMQMAIGKWICQALKVAADLGVADLLRDGARQVDEIARGTGMNEDALYRLLRALAGLGVFEESEGKRFQNNALSNALRSDAPGSMRAMIRWMGEPASWRAWGDFTVSVCTGQPAFDHATGESLFEYFAHHPETGEIFNDAMTSFSAETARAVARAYDFAPFKKLVDVGGGHGALLVAIADEFPGFEGILYDRPDVIPGARTRFSSTGHARRLTLRTGDFLDEVPEGGDAYVMKHVIHDWDDERACRILTNCRRAMAPGGKILVVEQVIGDGPESTFTKLLDLEMLAMTPGGRERTEAEFRSLFDRAGLELTRILRTESLVSIVEGVSAPGVLH